MSNTDMTQHNKIQNVISTEMRASRLKTYRIITSDMDMHKIRYRLYHKCPKRYAISTCVSGEKSGCISHSGDARTCEIYTAVST